MFTLQAAFLCSAVAGCDFVTGVSDKDTSIGVKGSQDESLEELTGGTTWGGS